MGRCFTSCKICIAQILAGYAEATKRVASVALNNIQQKTISKNTLNMSLCVNSVLHKNGQIFLTHYV